MVQHHTAAFEAVCRPSTAPSGEYVVAAHESLMVSFARRRSSPSGDHENLVQAAGFEPAWACSQGKWVAATRRLDFGGLARI